MPRKLAELAPEEVLGLAIDVEESNAVRFATVRDFFAHQDRAIYAVFDELHQEELEHLRILRDAVESIYPDGVPKVSELEVTEVIEAVDVDDGEHAIFDAITREDALRMALDAERYARALYERAAEQTDNASLKKVFRLLRDLEGDHEDMLLKMIDANSEAGSE